MAIPAAIVMQAPAAAQSGAAAGLETVQATPAHVSNRFRFEVHAPMARVAPMFGPAAEREWAGEHWKPEFLYPRPDADVQGAVWTVSHGDVKAVWVNTIFDLAAGRMQYVCFFPDAMVFTVDVRVTALYAATTAVEVTYVRTALTAEANEHVRELGKKDAASGPEWKEAIEGYLTNPKNDK
jgi:hypothetical protein